MMSSLEGIKAMTMFFDYRDKSFLLEIKASGGEATKNKQLADMLTGFKALGAGAAAKNPDVGELLNRIEISSGADFVKINAGLPEDILQRLSKSAAQKVEGMMKPRRNPRRAGRGTEKRRRDGRRGGLVLEHIFLQAEEQAGQSQEAGRDQEEDEDRRNRATSAPAGTSGWRYFPGE